MNDDTYIDCVCAGGCKDCGKSEVSCTLQPLDGAIYSRASIRHIMVVPVSPSLHTAVQLKGDHHCEGRGQEDPTSANDEYLCE